MTSSLHLLPFLLLLWQTSVEGVLSIDGSALATQYVNLRYVPFNSKIHQNSTFHHSLLQLELQGIVPNISVETIARNQTDFVSQSLVSNTALLLWAAGGEHLFSENSLKDLVFT